jgi:hypothetical protein
MRSLTALLILISCFFAKFARSQSNELLIQGQTGGLYLEHTVVAKENWYSVGRMYNIDPKALAPFNHSALTQPLMIGQLLQIPLTVVNFSQTGQKASGETLVPVIHITQDKEWLYRVSVNHNKVPVASLEKWNNTTPEQIHAGMHLIVGYLKVRTSQSALAKMPATPPMASAAPSTTTPAIATSTSPITKSSPTGPASTVDSDSPVSKPAVSSPSLPASTPPPTTTATPPTPITTAPVTPPPTHVATSPATTPPTHVSTTPATPTPVTTQPATYKAPGTATTPAATTPPAPHFNGGAFRADFNDGGHSATGPVGVFKSTSGWQDGKYYALMNNAAVGAIVKVTDPASGKSVFAKVLGTLPDMKESAGLTIRISNAAAAELGEGEGRFNALVNF